MGSDGEEGRYITQIILLKRVNITKREVMFYVYFGVLVSECKQHLYSDCKCENNKEKAVFTSTDKRIQHRSWCCCDK